MSAEDDLNAAQAYSASEANASGSAMASISASVSTAGQVKAKFDYYASFAPKSPSLKQIWDGKSVKLGTEWAAKTLENYGKAHAKEWTADAIKQVASAYGYEGFVPDQIPTNMHEAAVALADVGSAAFAAETGINPKLAEVTVEAVIDGKLDTEDCEAIGSTAGAIAGAALCQTFGIPAPIGAFLGGEIGGFVGKEVADIFGLSSRAYKKWLDEQRKIAAKQLADANDNCHKVRDGYWQTFDASVLAMEQRWEELELKLGARFGVRFFGKAPIGVGNYIDQHADYPFMSFLGPRTCGATCPDGASVRDLGPAGGLSKLSSADVYALQVACRKEMAYNASLPVGTRAAMLTAIKLGSNTAPAVVETCTHDCLADFGCPYPDLLGSTKYAPGASGLLNSPARVCAAYRALGFIWLPTVGQVAPSWGFKQSGNPTADAATLLKLMQAHPSDYRNTICDLPAATLAELKNKKKHQLWLNWLNAMISLEVRKIQGLNAATTRLAGDLAQTAATIAVQQKLADANTRRALRGLGALPSGTTLSSIVNNGALIGGLGWLAINSRKR